MANETGDSVKDRFAKRFEDETEQSAERETTENRDQSSKTENTSKTDRTEISPKNDWTNHSVYLSDDLASSLSRSYKRLDLDLDEEYGLSIKKTRHYYPLIVELGLEQLDDLDSKEVKDRLERLED
ncbi:hypothetical protein [Candidatus Halobonum tyrrellensis]|uniref:DUF8160 domain-containing protein n=1 Tax=Candidatus Halobonum tyrrellensis G22 TaxID=1324957 RepID=V4HPF5_9EURY|nr:hypothetical protein [Candidatus Halobonum tyrrellensis]ESP89789.1 hypothetical protein K933_02361 [Candidatus Halobonum tyrrellensis G22]